MKAVRAFVGHSFTQDDTEIVSPILNYLDRVADLHPSFTWTHAQHPEPVAVDDKVLAQLEGSNLFIGICTRRERVVTPSSLSPSWFVRDRLSAKAADFHWKTSDWIIQEIGLAIGKGMNIILLIEDGIKSPGSLQGNLEYIPLDRKAPAKSFDSLLAMLTALSPSTTSGTAAPHQERASNADEATLPNAAVKDNWMTPKPDWTHTHFEFAAMRAILTENSRAMQQVEEEFFASEFGRARDAKEKWEAYKEYTQIAYGRGGEITQLEKAAARLPHDVDIAKYLAGIYWRYEDYEKAAFMYQRAAENAASVPVRIQLMGEAALSHQKAANSAGAEKITKVMREICARTGEGEVELVMAERRIVEQSKSDDAEIALLERLLEMNPTDNETRFSLAFRYSNVDRDDLAAYHYSRIPSQSRTSLGWNNLGVALESLKLSTRAVAAYQMAAKQGETLAMSNLAYQFLNAGFVEEARAILGTALKANDHHKNIDKALGAVCERVDEEERKETDIYRKAKPESDFYRAYGCAWTRPLTGDLSGTWKAPNGNVLLSVEETIVTARGTYEVSQAIGLAAGLRGWNGANPASLRYILEYRGTLHGRTISGSVTRKKEEGEEKTSIASLLRSESSPDFLMWADDPGNVLYVMERQSTGGSRFYKIERL
ncbi:MAG: hypothetical protein V5B30_12570 [Candidatus Accumulibacter delftensis]|jgi:tetratricopeptide (TPR) repeat protein